MPKRRHLRYCSIPALHDPDHQSKSVLVFYGTGVSMWQYYPFLRQFSLADLQNFKAIYGISGGAVCLWYYVLSFIGFFDESRIERFDRDLRSLNHKSLVWRMLQLLRNRFVYDTNELAERIEIFASPSARRLPFSLFPLKNFIAVGFNEVDRSPLFLTPQTHPNFPMGDLIASLSFPRKLFGRRFCKSIPFDGFSLSDIDFAGADIRKHALARIKETHRSDRVYICNVFHSGAKQNVSYINCGSDRFPRLGQILDLLLLFGNLPNRRLYEVSQ